MLQIWGQKQHNRNNGTKLKPRYLNIKMLGPGGNISSSPDFSGNWASGGDHGLHKLSAVAAGGENG